MLRILLAGDKLSPCGWAYDGGVVEECIGTREGLRKRWK
jgi:hypothetical protein